MRCRACRSDRTEQVFAMAAMPLAGGFTATRAEAIEAPRWPLEWWWCADCGAVSTYPDIDDHLLFGAYRYATGDVPGLVRHFDEYASFLRSRGTFRRILEIGCNDGTLLRALGGGVGVDPSDVPSPGITRIHGRYTSDLARVLGTFDLVTSSNTLAHFGGLADALDGLAVSVAPGGELWIEVHDLDATLALGQWDTVYHEHKLEWSAPALIENLRLRGFSPIASLRTSMHGGALRVGFRHGKGTPAPVTRPVFRALDAAYASRRAPDLPPGSVAYGAAGRATVYLNQVDVPVRYVIDGSPRRYGRWVPGVGLPIFGPAVLDADDPPAVLITAWNHAADIRARHPDYSGEWVTTW